MKWVGDTTGAIAWCESIRTTVEAAEFHENKGLLASVYAIAIAQAGDYEQAEGKLDLALTRLQRGGTKMRRYFDTLSVAAECSYRIGKLDKARLHLEKALHVARLRGIDQAYPVAHYRKAFHRAMDLHQLLGTDFGS